MVNPDQTFLRFLELKIIAEKVHGQKDLAICASPKIIKSLKAEVKKKTGEEPKTPFQLFGCAVYEFEELPPENFLICDQDYARHCLKNRIPFSED